jgi:hypothetical protein
MARFLHLLKSDSAAVAAPVIEQNSRQPGADVTVILLDGALSAALPSSVHVRRLGEGGLDYSGLLDLIFDSDHVLSW